MTGTRKGDETVVRPAGGSGDREGENTGAAAGGSQGSGSGGGGGTPDGRGAAAEPGAPGAGEPARTESSGVLAPAAATPADPAAKAKDSPATTDPVATAEPVAANPVAIADPVAPAPATPAAAAPGSAAHDDRETGGPLMVPSERDEWGDRLHRATGRFVDDPPGAVDDACVVLGDLGERIAALLAERRDACRDLTRRARAAEGAANAETERLRLALRDSRDLAERLLTS